MCWSHRFPTLHLLGVIQVKAAGINGWLGHAKRKARLWRCVKKSSGIDFFLLTKRGCLVGLKLTCWFLVKMGVFNNAFIICRHVFWCCRSDSLPFWGPHLCQHAPPTSCGLREQMRHWIEFLSLQKTIVWIYPPPRMPVTIRIFTLLVPYKHSLATVTRTGWGVDPK